MFDIEERFGWDERIFFLKKKSYGLHLISSTDMVEFILISKNILSMILFDLKLVFVAHPFSAFVVFVCLFV